MQTITLGNDEFEGRNNAYLLDGETTALIDTGISMPSVREGLESGLGAAGVDPADLDLVVLTHWHYDHAGLSGWLQAAGDARVLVHTADAPLVRQDEAAVEDLLARQRERFEAWGMPEDARAELLDFLEAGKDMAGEPASVEPIADGDVIEAGDLEIEAVHAPGHTAGLCCFEFEGESGREAFVGDALLPVYTPNVGGADLRVDRPLERYLDTLDRLESRGYERVWPGHRSVIESPAERAREIATHHRERTERVVSVLREESGADAWTVSARLFGDLSGIHVLHGPGEAYAHLDHLHRGGVVTVEDGEYRLVEPEPDLDALF